MAQARTQDRPGEAEEPPGEVRHLSRTAAFSELVSDHMAQPPPIISMQSHCGDVVKAMRERHASSVLVADDNVDITGIVTEQDVARHITYQLADTTPIERIMSSPVLTIRDDDYLYHAIATMRRNNLRHMPAIDRQGRVTGMLHLHTALAETSASLMHQIDRLTHEETIEGLHQVKNAQVEVAEDLFAENVPAPEIQCLLTQINNDIYRRILELSVKEMENKQGKPPVRFCAIVMGSGGRGESFLFPDQDNGYILEDYPDADHDMVDPYFIELAERMTRALDGLGISLCRGFVMATNPLWRKSLSQWSHQVRGWLSMSNKFAISLSDIFFDFNSVYGVHELADKLRTDVTAVVKRQHLFLKEMQHTRWDLGVALGWFGRLITDRSGGPHHGKLNLKHHGLLPLVASIRLLALREGIPDTGTIARINALHSHGVLTANEQDYLIGGFDHITKLMLRQQIDDFKADHKVSAYVPMRALTRRDRDMLRNTFRAIERLRDRVKAELTVEVF
jgi:CBS domain-containing protein